MHLVKLLLSRICPGFWPYQKEFLPGQNRDSKIWLLQLLTEASRLETQGAKIYGYLPEDGESRF